jgi:SecD/SecF fusion protein
MINNVIKENHTEEKKIPENPLGNGIPLYMDIDSSKQKKTDSTNSESPAEENPLFTFLNPNIYRDASDQQWKLAPGPVVGYCLIKDTARVMSVLTNDSIIYRLPKYVRFAWGMYSMKGNQMIPLYALNYDSLGTHFLAGNILEKARMDKDAATEEPAILMLFNQKSAKDFYVMTKRNIQKSIAILVDDRVAAAPRVIAEIKVGKCTITGGEEADLKTLSIILDSGYMNVRYTVKMVVH